MEEGKRGDRRVLGVLAARFGELRFDRVADPRSTRGRRWSLKQLLTGCLVGLVSGAHSLREVEEVTKNLARPIRTRLGIPRRVPDTTMRNAFVSVHPDDVRRVIHRQIRQANRRKQLGHGDFPFGVIAIDGKCTSTRFFDGVFAQRQTLKNGEEIVGAQGLVRTLTTCLITSAAKVCIDAIPIPAATNEVGHFKAAFSQIVATYGRSDLFQMVTLDAGFTSAENAELVCDAGYGYLMRLKDERRELTATAKGILGHLGPDETKATSHDKHGGKVITRSLWMAPIEDVPGWPSARRIIRVQSITCEDGKTDVLHDRYYVSSYGAAGLSADQWLSLVRRHWAVENSNHWVFDTAFQEDAHPCIIEPQGMVVMILLRRIAYNMLALYRCVTLRGPKNRATTWPALLRAVNRALIRATEATVRALRPRRLHTCPA